MMHHRILAALAATAIGMAASLAAVAAPAAAVPTTYYVDAVAGDNNAAGTTTSSAWKTLAKVNATTFQPGDSILFKSGQTWNGQLHPLGSGTSGSPITISSYGTGSKPLINGASLPSGWGTGAAVYLVNQQYWTISGLAVKSNSGVDNFGGLNEADWKLQRHGILVYNNGAGTLGGITITNNTVSDVNGCFTCQGIEAHSNGGIVVRAEQENDSFSGVSIDHNSVSNVGRGGIVFWDESTGLSLTDWVIDQPLLSTGVKVEDNTVSTIDSDGVLVLGTYNAMLQRNVVANAGQRTIENSTTAPSAGLWPTRSIGAVVQYNEVYGTLTHGTDGQGFDVDLASIDTLVQYNYSHDNEGGFLLMMAGASSNLTVRNNLSVNDGYGGEKGIFTFSYGVPINTEIYNNTIYVKSGLASKIMYCDGCDGSTGGAWSFRNNIVVNNGSGGYTYPNTAGAVFDYNVFYGNHPSSEPADPHKLTSNPLLVSPSTTAPTGLTSVAGYTISSTSPAKGSGTLIVGNGGKDYFGNVLSPTAVPSRGFHEANTMTDPGSLGDPLNNWNLTTSHSANMVLDTTGPMNQMAGDASRVSRSDASAGSVTWSLAGMKTFSARVYHYWSTIAITWQSSTNGTTWTTVATNTTAPTATANYWSRTTFTPTANLPAGTTYLRATISDATPWAVQIGDIVITK
ncbi:right-handed parallel beta-helix repeat-containing protein [Antiquaquibacter soli]|uniref:Right-handed parallel beta-helix repeat-containing protein n=1 Tax=Antiquaquibacter soli TaxID=3064523 RepID=A0ABT9BQZ7_9MICO|nr:right-handed parallel beta-helix repeat-containing protein [Protaetiibacter sp. WY-16]MDO7883440.1 right-handed parallel beta-helix repeat-containing protein [Protaetiibacter sp. WY-16]